MAQVENPGENLQDHLQLRMVYKVSGVPTLNEKASRLMGKAAIGLEYLLKPLGPDVDGAQPAGNLHPLGP